MSTLEDLEQLSTDSDDEEYIPEGAVRKNSTVGLCFQLKRTWTLVFCFVFSGEGGVGSESSVSEGEGEPVVQDEDEDGKPALRTRKAKLLTKKKQSRSPLYDNANGSL